MQDVASIILSTCLTFFVIQVLVIGWHSLMWFSCSLTYERLSKEDSYFTLMIINAVLAAFEGILLLIGTPFTYSFFQITVILLGVLTICGGLFFVVSALFHSVVKARQRIYDRRYNK